MTEAAPLDDVGQPMPAGQAWPSRGSELVPEGRGHHARWAAFPPKMRRRRTRSPPDPGRAEAGRVRRTPDGQSLGRGQPHLNASFQFAGNFPPLGLPRLHLTRQAGSEVHSESIRPACHRRPCGDHGVPGLPDHCAGSAESFNTPGALRSFCYDLSYARKYGPRYQGRARKLAVNALWLCPAC